MAASSAVSSELRSAGLPSWIGILYIILAGLYFYPAFKLNQYASRIGQLLISKNEQDLVAALDAQRSFWFFIGIMALITIVGYILMMVFLFNNISRI